MTRPNMACDAPPVTISVDGHAYRCRTDYRLWLEVIDLLERGDIIAAEWLAFGGVLTDEDETKAAEAMCGFLKGYPQPFPPPEGDALISLTKDINDIVMAVRDRGGPDISFRRREPFHWWLFLEEVRTLAGEHAVLYKAEARAYRGDDPRLIRRREALSADKDNAPDERLIREIDELFSGAI